MKGSPFLHWIIVFTLWSLLAIPIYMVAKDENKSPRIHNTEKPPSKVTEKSKGWIKIKSSPPIRKLLLTQGKDILIQESEFEGYELEEEIALKSEAGHIEMHLKANYKGPNVGVVEVILSLNNHEDMSTTLWGENGFIDGIVEFNAS